MKLWTRLILDWWQWSQCQIWIPLFKKTIHILFLCPGLDPTLQRSSLTVDLVLEYSYIMNMFEESAELLTSFRFCSGNGPVPQTQQLLLHHLQLIEHVYLFPSCARLLALFKSGPKHWDWFSDSASQSFFSPSYFSAQRMRKLFLNSHSFTISVK